MPSSTTSPWPWVEEDRSKKEPIAPVTEYDDRPAVRDLIARHSVKIEEVRSKLNENKLFDEKKHDDLWILRFLLSHNLKTKPSTEAALPTLRYRDLHNLDDVSILDDWPGLQCSHPQVRKYQSCCDDDAFRYCLPHPQRGLVAYVRLAGVQQTGTSKRYKIQTTCPLLFFLNGTFRVVDVSNFERSMMNHESQKRNGELAKKLSHLYPQLLAKMFICNAPGWLYMFFNTFRPIRPKRLVEKVEFCQPTDKEKDLKKLLAFVSEEHIPTRLGGSYETWPVEEWNVPTAGN